MALRAWSPIPLRTCKETRGHRICTYVRTYVRIYVGTSTFQANTREQSHADALVPLDWCILIVCTCTVLYTQHG